MWLDGLHCTCPGFAWRGEVFQAGTAGVGSMVSLLVLLCPLCICTFVPSLIGRFGGALCVGLLSVCFGRPAMTTHSEIYHYDAVAVITLDPLRPELVQSFSEVVCLQRCVYVLACLWLVMTVTT